MGGRVTSLAPGAVARSFCALKMKGGADHVHFDLQSFISFLSNLWGGVIFSAGSGESCGFRGFFFFLK